MHIPTLIEKNRDGHELMAEEIDFLVSGFTHSEIPNYQISAWAMATFFRGMTPAETQHLTMAMMQTGSILEYPPDSPPKVDKHSTGGDRDKNLAVPAPPAPRGKLRGGVDLGRHPGNPCGPPHKIPVDSKIKC